MKKLLILIFSALIIFVSSCKEKEAVSPSSNQYASTASASPSLASSSFGKNFCGSSTATLYAGQHINAGSVVMTNDKDSLYITYIADGGWQINQTHLYIGSLANMPKAPNGNPKIGNFPFKTAHNPAITSFTYSFPLDKFDNCFIVAAHAEVFKQNADGSVQKETGWADGKQLVDGGSWATYAEYCIATCVPACVYETVKFDILGGQTINEGALEVTNDKDTLYVTYKLANGWFMKETHLYVGTLEGLPANNQSTPVPGQFPYKTNHEPLANTYTYKIALNSLPPCYIIAAHAATVKMENGAMVQEETSWSYGTAFPNSNRWGWYSNYCTQVCK